MGKLSGKLGTTAVHAKAAARRRVINKAVARHGKGGAVHATRVQAKREKRSHQQQPTVSARATAAALTGRGNAGDDEEEEDAVSEEDIAFFRSNPQFASFLSAIDEEKLEARRVKALRRQQRIERPAGAGKPTDSDEEASLDDSSSADGEGQSADDVDDDDDDDDRDAVMDKIEAEHASRGRSWSNLAQEPHLLPVKDTDGRVRAAPGDVDLTGPVPSNGHASSDDDDHDDGDGDDDGADSDDDDADADDDDDDDDSDVGDVDVAELARQVVQAKARIAAAAQSILQDPEGNIAQVHDLHVLSGPKHAFAIRRLALLSQVAVFRDIAPGYRIRPLTPAEQAETVSKQVEARRQWEKSLLAGYQRLLQTLERLSSGKAVTPERVLGVQCMTQLLEALPHFNFRDNLVTALAPFTNSPHPALREPACRAATSLFQRLSTHGDVILRLLHRMQGIVRAAGFHVQPDMLRTLLVLPLRSDFVAPTEEQAKLHAKARKARKKARKDEVGRAMQEAQAELPLDQQARIHSEVLAGIFYVYFRVLKSAPSAAVMPVVLKGLARYSHMISVDFMPDLLAVLRDLVGRAGERSISLADALRCAIAAFQTLLHHRGVLTIDLREFYQRVFAVLADLSRIGADRCDALMPLLLRCLRLMLLDHRQLSMERVAAFALRCVQLAVQVYPNAALALLTFVAELQRRYPKLNQLFDGDFHAPGVYLPELNDPDQCNPFAATAWLMVPLQRLYHGPTAAAAASLASASATGQGTRARPPDPIDLLRQYSANDGGFNPTPPLPPTVHPLAKRAAATKAPVYLRRASESRIAREHASVLARVLHQDAPPWHTVFLQAASPALARQRRRVRRYRRVLRMYRQWKQVAQSIVA